MNWLKRSSLVTFLLILSLPIPCSALGKSAATPVHLRINQYYVLYTAPASPYVDNGRLYLPLRSLSELLGAQVTYDSDTATANILFKSNRLQIHNHNQADQVQIRQQSIYVPVRLLLNGLGLNGVWDQQTKMLTIQEDRVQTLERFQLASELDQTSILSNEAFRPLSFTWNQVTFSGHHKMRLSVTAKNISGHLIPEGQEDLHPTYFFKGGVTLESLPRPRPAIKSNEIFTREWERTLNQTPQYILLEGRTIQ
ncbi:copper amine oxidase N-terminal domain-containing protein [Paenibacillus spiritus]|uniref:Copper amine oxidase N-terminal domain-containing protein n=1 Tax=Paenibacillus spiritus TaxID=2496557 RepID=A0A5J5GDG3_9BACL|nr:stalk domain-containing protein [Paenibacillus spiritus]KAA9005484.1 copper amine oxidase N-terminal domain-containing protein [Paenibacillus spiritus]